MIKIAIIKKERGGTRTSSRIVEKKDYNTARAFVEEFNKEDKGIPRFCEYATIVVDF